MCVIGAKYLESIGWVGFKNRDRNYPAKVMIVKEFGQLERLTIRDTLTNYSEGINEKGVCILSSALDVSVDENEFYLARAKELMDESFFSIVGENIKNALSLNLPKEALKFLIDRQTTGHTLIFTEDICYILEGDFRLNDDGTRSNDYEYSVKEIAKEEKYVLRTNHGIYLPYAGYQYNLQHWQRRESSEKRWQEVERNLESANSQSEILGAISVTPNENVQFNPLRLDISVSNMRTTGQIMMISKLRELAYRPILGELVINQNIRESNKTTFSRLKDYAKK